MPLHPNLQKKDFICDLPLCMVLFEDNKNYPWVFLVPKRDDVKSMRDLSHTDHVQLMNEIEYVEGKMAELFTPTQTNVAMIGNVTPQLHVHIICRHEGDPAWPGTVWGEKALPYTDAEKKEIILKIQTALTPKGE